MESTKLPWLQYPLPPEGLDITQSVGLHRDAFILGIERVSQACESRSSIKTRSGAGLNLGPRLIYCLAGFLRNTLDPNDLRSNLFRPVLHDVLGQLIGCAVFKQARCFQFNLQRLADRAHEIDTDDGIDAVVRK